MKLTSPAGRSRLVAVILSAIIPGLGQGWLGNWARALGVFLATATALGATLWYGKTAWLAIPAALCVRSAEQPAAAGLWRRRA